MQGCCCDSLTLSLTLWLLKPPKELQLNLSITDIFYLGQKKVADVERFKQESMYRLCAKKVAVSEKWPLVGLRLYL